MKKLLIVLLSLMSVLGYGQKYLDYEDGWIVIKRNASGEVTIPEKVKIKGVTYEVTKVRASFKGGINYTKGNKIHRLVLPNTVKMISLRGCVEMEEVVLSNSLEVICSNCFLDNTHIKKIVIPNSVKSIGSGAFRGCSNLESLTLGNSLEEMGWNVFYGTKISELFVPNSVKIIDCGTFHGMKYLKYLVLPDYLQKINSYNRSPIIVDHYKHLRYEVDKMDYNHDFELRESGQLKVITGHRFRKPAWWWLFDTSGPFYLERPKGVNDDGWFSNIIPYSIFARIEIGIALEKWQKKGEFETTQQWKDRVTETAQQELVSEVLCATRSEYINRYKPNKSFTYSLGQYDTERMAFPLISNSSRGNFYISVPLDEAPEFKKIFSKASVEPKFGIVDDYVAATDYSITINGKNYSVTNTSQIENSNDLAINLPPIQLDFGDDQTKAPQMQEKQNPAPKTFDRTIDQDIPTTRTSNVATFVLIIGNENYKHIQKVKYANNDAKVFANYCQKTLGIPQNNIQSCNDASLNDMRHAINVLSNKLQAFKGEARAIVYYSGHGYPDEATRMPYLMPVDGYATDVVKTGFSLKEAYEELAKAPSKLTLFLLDACFSGAQRDGEMVLAAKGLALAARTTAPSGNLLVFSASQGSETAFIDEEHGHGRFTYFLLKHLHETKGNTTIGNMVDYVKDHVLKASVTLNDGKAQNPTSNASFSLGDKWKEMKLR